jgi:hypothetical protein
VNRNRGWAAFDERVRIVERAYVERLRQQAAALIRRCGDVPSEAFLDEIAGAALASGAFRDKAWQVAMLLYGKPARQNSEKVIDLREMISSTGSSRRKVLDRAQQRVDVLGRRVAHDSRAHRAASVA